MSEGKIGSYIYFIDSLFSILNSINLILQNLENRVYLVLVIYVIKIKIKKIVFKKNLNSKLSAGLLICWGWEDLV